MSRKFKIVRVIGVPSDLGANMRGANIGPSAVRIAGLHEKISVLGYGIEDAGDILVPIRETLPDHAVREKYLGSITDVCTVLHMEVEASLDRDILPIVIGGDHSIAMGSISGSSAHYRKKNERIGLIWVDAHADMNTPASSPTGNIHGMPLSVSLGKGLRQLVELGGFAGKLQPQNVALIGIRTLDHEEKRICRESGIRYFTMREIDERGMAPVMKEAIAVATNGTSGIHVSFDIDAVDPLYAPGVSTPVTGGLSYREAHLALEMIADTGMLTSMEFVELNPMRDVAHKTAELLVELVQSALGKSIV
ncbi:MAG: hypothetical protein RIQ81_193 [Pseudomonadota bacterium]